MDENEDKLDLLFNKEPEVLKSEGPDVILDEPLEPVIKKPDVEIALTERTPEIADEIKRPVSGTVNNLSDLQTETAEINKPSKVVKPAPITQPEVEVSQTLENTTKSVDKLSVTEKKENFISDTLVSSLKPKSRPPRVSKPNFENKSVNMQIYNVTDNIDYSSSQIYDTLREALGKRKRKLRFPYIVFKVLSFLHPSIKYRVDKLLGNETYSCSKILSLGFRPERTLKQINETNY